MDIILKHLPIKMKFEVGINDTNSRVINGEGNKGLHNDHEILQIHPPRHKKTQL